MAGRKNKDSQSGAVKSRRTVRDTVIDTVIYLVFGIFAIICIYPFYYIFINSISANNLVQQGKIMFVPQGIHLNNYANILPGAVSAYNMILIKTYMESISPSLEESAVLDGAGYAVRFLKIILPLSKPILATVAVFKAVGEWNAYMDTILYMRGGKFPTLQSMLWNYLNQATQLSNILMSGNVSDSAAATFELNPISVRYTLTFVTVLPILCVYPYFQRFFVKGIMIGAVKG